MKKYEIAGKINNRKVFVKDGDSGVFRELLPDRSQNVYNHSPDGFAWGYGGSGPSQLALALMLELKDRKEKYHSLVGAVVSRLKHDEDFVITMFVDGDLITVPKYNGNRVNWSVKL